MTCAVSQRQGVVTCAVAQQAVQEHRHCPHCTGVQLMITGNIRIPFWLKECVKHSCAFKLGT